MSTQTIREFDQSGSTDSRPILHRQAARVGGLALVASPLVFAAGLIAMLQTPVTPDTSMTAHPMWSAFHLLQFAAMVLFVAGVGAVASVLYEREARLSAIAGLSAALLTFVFAALITTVGSFATQALAASEAAGTISPGQYAFAVTLFEAGLSGLLLVEGFVLGLGLVVLGRAAARTGVTHRLVGYVGVAVGLINAFTAGLLILTLETGDVVVLMPLAISLALGWALLVGVSLFRAAGAPVTEVDTTTAD